MPYTKEQCKAFAIKAANGEVVPADWKKHCEMHMKKFSDDDLPGLARSYYGEKRARFIETANYAYDLTDDEPTAIFAGMLAAGEERNAYSRALILKQRDQLEWAREFVNERVDFAKNNVLDAEIFAVGRWNKAWVFSASDLDQIVATFGALAAEHRVPLKFGHNDKQPLTDGQPALGWVTQVWRKGEKLMARFEHVPDTIVNLIKQKSYRHVSVELDVDVQDRHGRKHKYVLSAVALLGADRPAVSTLADLDTFVDDSASLFTASHREVFSAISGNRSKEDDMTPEELRVEIDKSMRPLNDKITALEGDNVKLKEENARFKASAEANESEAKKAKVTTHRATLTAKFEAAVKAKQITPAQREMGLKFMRIDQDDTVLSVTAESVDDYIKVNGGKAKMNDEQGRGAGSGGGGSGGDGEDAGAKIVRLAQVEQAKNPRLSFSDARNLVMRADPELAKAWMGEIEE